MDSTERYEHAVAAERAAFQAMMAAGDQAPEYSALLERWRAAMAEADNAREAMLKALSRH
jgi:Cys-tRNA synthase (O-phospho-L-seryl-tRNA:Cys-tRNA synthase)